MAKDKIVVLRERDMILPVSIGQSLYVGAYAPFGHKVAEINTCGGILAPISGLLTVEAIEGANGWRWEYRVRLGEEWEYTSRDEFKEVEERVYAEWRKRDFQNMRQIAAPPAYRSKKADGLTFTLSVERIASSPFPGLDLGRIMHDMGIPVVMLQNQIVGPAWGSFHVQAVDDLDGWVYIFDWIAGEYDEGMRVAGQDVIDNWREVAIEHAVERYSRRKGGTPRDDEMTRRSWQASRPPTATDNMGRIVDAERELAWEDDDEL